MLRAIAVISAGAAVGATLRWLLGVKLNAVSPNVPLGTLLANLIGGYLIGVAIAYMGSNAALAPEWRLLIITGFLGGLTTFSTFSAETVSLLQQGRVINACALIGLHVIGSLAMTMLGMLTVTALRNS